MSLLFSWDEDGGRGGREGDFCILRGDGKEPRMEVLSSLLGDGE